MPGPSLIQRQVEALKELARLAEDRAQREFKIEAEAKKATAVAERTYQTARQGAVRQRELQIEAVEKAIQETRTRLEAQYNHATLAAKTERDQKIAHAKKRHQVETEAAETALEEAGWETGAVHDANMDKVRRKHEQFQRRLQESLATLEEVRHAADTFLASYARYISLPPEGDEESLESNQDPIPKLDDAIVRIGENYVGATQIGILPLVKLDFFIFLCVVLFLVVLIAVGLVLGNWMIAAGVAVVVTGVVGAIARSALVATAKAQLTTAAGPLLRAVTDADRYADRSARWVEENYKRLVGEVERRRDATLKKAHDTHDALIPELEARLNADIKAAEERYPKALAEATKAYNDQTTATEDQYQKDLAAAKAEGDAAIQEVEARHYADVEARRVAYEASWDRLIADWKAGVDHAKSELGAVAAEGDRLFLPWHDPAWNPWTPPKVSPPVLRFGEVKVPLAMIPKAIPEDPRLREFTPDEFRLPAFLQFPDRISLLIKASDEGRVPAIQALQAAMLRFLTAIPPGKVRFTILDPVGLGQNFSTFMHLKDADELLVTSRIWTEQGQIDQRLLDLTEHMENVIQTYLRNEYESIEEYNEMAGEVAEPYRVLVVANYPANFSDVAQRRLVSITNSGPRCGVYTLVSLDTKLQNATSPLAKDLEPGSVNVVWKEGRWIFKDSPFEPYPLRLDVPPDDQELNRIVRLAGEAAKQAKRVEVPFEVIAPPLDKLWTWDSRSGVDVPLGRAGATKFQNLKLGKGTSQHVIIAGKTGSGKSTLLHALITNVALMYSPKEVELYLIDFKKGVEFKTYATYGLPHARVIAVESEREFGLSVLQRLDTELTIRGDKYRETGAQDVASYRRITGEFLPRILLLVDEFQEFFIEDDKLAQDASLKLDRLVRQGRAFGIHVHLGSQTLGGAYSLARTTLAQMAIRIALQCSEADSHLILSEDNSAARLLTRPGEAIYNDANGMVEGNHIFQVVWLEDSKREAYLKTLRRMAEEQGLLPDTPQLVFEGNLPADVAKNPLFNERLAADGFLDEVRAASAWVGDAIAIKDPTNVVFRRQSGSHLLLVGQQDEAALGILSMAVLSLAAQHRPASRRESSDAAKFFILDGSPPDSPNVGVLARLGEVIPHPFQAANWRELAPVMTTVADELARRQAEDLVDGPSIYLIIYDLGRFRDLRRSEDDYGFSSKFGEEEKPSPSKQLVTILREGPNFGVHVLCWCDTVGNLNRSFERSTAGEFEQRILFQMSINDSSALIDSPAAGRLGENRALYFNEEQGKTEKFRPYGLPDPAWLATVHERLQAKLATLPPEPEVVEPPSAPVSSVDPLADSNGHEASETNGHGDDAPIFDPASGSL
jgi:ABC-type multidrug transport system fused ATPase/permease subunit